MKLGRESNAITVFNAAPAPTEPLPEELFRYADVVCPNEVETGILTGMPTSTEDECDAAARRLLAMGAGAVVLTLGERGCLLVRPDEASVRVAVPERFKGRQVVDTTGAGDAFLGAFAHLVACGLGYEAALEGAVEVASMSVLKRGAQSSYPVYDDLPAGLLPPKPTTADEGTSTAGTPKKTMTRSRSFSINGAAAAAKEAVDTLVKSGMILGVGTGSTVGLCLERIASKLKDGSLKDILAMPTSDATTRVGHG